MKKRFVALCSLLVMAVLGVQAEPAVFALHHEGKVTMFYSYQVNEVMEAAATGDTIYVSEGVITSDISITKAVHIIGSGQGTVIYGKVYFDVEKNPTLEGYLLENMDVRNYIVIRQSAKGFRMSKVSCQRLDNNNGNQEMEGLYLVNCYIQRIYCNIFLSASIVNSKIGEVASGYGSKDATMTTFVNCDFVTSTNLSAWNTYINCIFYRPVPNTSPSSYINCLFVKSGYGDLLSYYCYNSEGCWRVDEDPDENPSLDDDLNCTWTNEQLVAAGYVGTDDTAVGAMGGPAPFTLTPVQPRVTEHSVDVNNLEKKVTVTLKLSNE